ncbi:MAG: DUF6090 family protein, partial [Flavobacteriaceae bacterium]|nr:DUF6090 family protein [Flavobacteriaceae bacterium]
MIKFFRIIRRDMITKNRVSKYMLYAIGEIILVVIGILIALQINNWNERQKEEVVEIDMLSEVRMGLMTDLKDAKYNLQLQQSKLRSQNIFIDFLETTQSFHDSLSKHVNNIHYGTYFQSNESPYQTLKQIGLRTITNDSLRNQITSLYDLDYQQYDKYNEEYEDLGD